MSCKPGEHTSREKPQTVKPDGKHERWSIQCGRCGSLLIMADLTRLAKLIKWPGNSKNPL